MARCGLFEQSSAFRTCVEDSAIPLSMDGVVARWWMDETILGDIGYLPRYSAALE